MEKSNAANPANPNSQMDLGTSGYGMGGYLEVPSGSYQVSGASGSYPAPVIATFQPPCSPMENLQVTDSFASNLVDSSIYKNDGAILHFINHNCSGATTHIGAIRLKIVDPRMIPVHLMKHRGAIKAYAISLLQKHLLENQCVAGVGEKLSHEDYGMTFAVASLSAQGRSVIQPDRNEGPIYMALCPHLLQEIELYDNEDGSKNAAIIINIHIHLLEAVRRRGAVLKRLNEEAARKKELALENARKEELAKNEPPPVVTPSYIVAAQPVIQYSRNQAKRVRKEAATSQEAPASAKDFSKFREEVRQDIRQMVPIVAPYPQLPNSQGRVWVHSENLPDMSEIY